MQIYCFPFLKQKSSGFQIAVFKKGNEKLIRFFLDIYEL
jgi:hypothetical protein